MNDLKIYKGSVSAANLIHGVDKDSFTLTTTLDETFDNGMFNVVSSADIILKPRDTIVIVETEDGVTVSSELYLVDTIGKTVIRKTSDSVTYEYQISFIERTAELQNILCPNLATTQPLSPMWKDNSSQQIITEPWPSTKSNNDNQKVGFMQAYQVALLTATAIETSKMVASGTGTATLQIPPFGRRHGMKQFPTIQIVWGNWESEYYMEVYNSSGTKVAYGYYSTLSSNPPSLSADKYTVKTYYKDSELFSTDDDWRREGLFYTYQVEFRPYSQESRDLIEDKYHTIYETLEKLIYSIKPYKTTNGVPTNPKYTLGESCESLKNELCPDLYFTGNNLFENLLTVGRCCNMIPWLDADNKIQMLDIGKHDALPETYDTESFNASTDIMEYQRCGALVSDLQNMVSTNKLSGGTVADTWRCLESEVGNQTTADNSYYRSDYKIYQLKDFRIRYWSNPSDSTTMQEASIMNYMFESAQYNCLDPTTNSGKNSRSHALCYSQYDDKITGWTHKSTEYDPTGMINHTAICNILAVMFGLTVTTTLVENWPKRIMCQAVYVPLTDARLKQFREDAREFNDNEMILGQQTNLGNLELVGQSMKNSFAQTGNAIHQMNKFLKNYAQIPEINQEIGVWKVSKVIRAFSSLGYDTTVIFSKNFNRIDANQSLATEKRWADVPMGGAIKRTVHLEDFVVIENRERSYVTSGATDKFLTNDGTYTALYSLFKYIGQTNRNKALTFYFRLKNKDGSVHYPNTGTCLAESITDYSWIKLPCIVGSFGNSIFIKAVTKDNYSAGTGLINRTVNGNNYKFTIDIPYADENGEGMLLDFKIGCKPQSFSSYKQDNILATDTEIGLDYILVQGNNVYLNKDAREQLEFVYQLHFIAGDDSIVIGKMSSELNQLTVDKDLLEKSTLKLYITDHKINQFEQNLDVEHSVMIGHSEALYSGGGLKPWAECVADEDYEDLYFNDAFGLDTERVSVGLYAEYTQTFYDGRPPQQKSELVLARVLTETETWSSKIDGFKFAFCQVLSDYPLANTINIL